MEIDAIIEVPQNSKVKYEFCSETKKISVDRILQNYRSVISSSWTNDWRILIQNYFPKTVLITHLDSVKENIQEKIMITKVDGFSRIECFFLR